jgi:hypothetical protein
MARWAARSRNAAINLGAYQFCSGVVRASAQLVQDAAFPIESCLARQFAERFGRNFENVFTNGSGKNDGSGPAVRRGQEFRLRPRTLRPGHRRIREQKADPRSLILRFQPFAMARRRVQFESILAELGGRL